MSSLLLYEVVLTRKKVHNSKKISKTKDTNDNDENYNSNAITINLNKLQMFIIKGKQN